MIYTDFYDPSKDTVVRYPVGGGGSGGSSGVSSFNGRNGSVLPVAGDYDATQINYDNNTTVKQKIDALVTGVSSFNGRSGSILPVAGDYTADKIIFSSTLNIGGQTQTDVEAGIAALNRTKVECVVIATEQEWNNMSAAEKNDPSKLYFLPWDN